MRPQLPMFEISWIGSRQPASTAECYRPQSLAGLRFCGVVPSGQPVPDWLDEIDIYLELSFKEGLPRRRSKR
jgi:hypothetical protein